MKYSILHHGNGGCVVFSCNDDAFESCLNFYFLSIHLFMLLEPPPPKKKMKLK